MLAKLGLRMRDPYSVEQLAVLAASFTNGMGLRAGISDVGERIVRTPHNDGEWNLLGVGFLALALELIEDAVE